MLRLTLRIKSICKQKKGRYLTMRLPSIENKEFDIFYKSLANNGLMVQQSPYSSSYNELKRMFIADQQYQHLLEQIKLMRDKPEHRQTMNQLLNSHYHQEFIDTYNTEYLISMTLSVTAYCSETGLAYEFKCFDFESFKHEFLKRLGNIENELDISNKKIRQIPRLKLITYEAMDLVRWKETINRETDWSIKSITVEKVK